VKKDKLSQSMLDTLNKCLASFRSKNAP